MYKAQFTESKKHNAPHYLQNHKHILAHLRINFPIYNTLQVHISVLIINVF
jgi:hypothetical protein